ncbi:MAG: DUF1905 domain-containing protein [Acidobacteriia bacterium]|nr:DUF1905 domain-containing protein [Terriglobia bacterium]
MPVRPTLVEAMPQTRAKSFGATLERMESRLNWVIVRIPFDVSEVWGTRGQLKVKGEISGLPFRTSLFPTGDGSHILLVNKQMQAGAKVGVGMIARFRLEPDTAERKTTIPTELQKHLSQDRSLRRWFDQLTYSARNEVGHWITGVKSAEARERRAAQIAERLLETMEAERELPPLIRRAFESDPRAYEGWQQMSVSRRRGHLFGIFYYRDPKSRARRLAKALQDAYDFGQKRARRGA